jgi:hypothetical protein
MNEYRLHSPLDPQEDAAMVFIVLWLLGVPLGLIVLLWLLGVFS